MPASDPSPPAILWRGARKRCPRCGRGPLFSGWYALRRACDQCGLSFESYEGNTWAFMYVSTAGITGFIVIAMFLLHPPTLLAGRLAVLAAALAAIVGTLPRRKGIGIALDYLTEVWWNRTGDE